MEMNLEKLRDVFTQNMLIYKNLHHVLHGHLILGEMNTSQDPIFHQFKRQKVKVQMAKRSGFKAIDHPQIPPKECWIFE
jgi:hypothetical protein